MGYAIHNAGYLVFVPPLDKIVVSVHVVSIPHRLEFCGDRAAQDRVTLESRDPGGYQVFVGMQYIDVENGLVYETMRVTIRKGYIVAYRRLVTTPDCKPREESTLIYVADVARIY